MKHRHIKKYENFISYTNEEFFFNKPKKTDMTLKIERLESILNEFSIEFDNIYFSTMKKVDSCSTIEELLSILSEVIQQIKAFSYIDSYAENTLNKLIEYRSSIVAEIRNIKDNKNLN